MNATRKTHRAAMAVAVAAASVGFSARPAVAIVSSHGGANPPFTGININNFIGANVFYSNGYTGSRAVAATMQPTDPWNGHETLGHVTTFLRDPAAPPLPIDANYDAWVDYNTGVAGVIGGRPSGAFPEVKRGIAYGADLWSGALASELSSGSFTITPENFRHPYHTALVTGVGGRTADVVFTGWGTPAVRNNSYRSGRILDAWANQTGKTLVTLVGQAGATATPGAWGPGASFNHIAAAGLGTDTDTLPYALRAGGSSYGPDDFWNPATGTFVTGVLASVDLAAPTRDLTVPAYAGSGSGTNIYRSNASGIAMATSVIAGGAALVVDVGKDRFGGGSSIDGRVVKSVLQNSATRIGGWDNGQTLSGGVVTTNQSLDYKFGAGRIDLARAYQQYTAGTTDLPGSGGGTVQSVGWDFGEVADGAPSDYPFQSPLEGGTVLTATLNWFLDNSYDYASDTLVDQSLDNLDLEVWRSTPGGGADVLVAESKSTYNNVEHLSFVLPETAEYFLRVRWSGEVFDTIADANTEVFALAWANGPVPAWASASGGNWSAAANWSSAAAPNEVGAVAKLGPAITAPGTVTLDVPVTLESLKFDSDHTYTIGGAQTLTLDGTAGNAAINVMNGTHVIAAPVTLLDTTDINVAAGRTLSFTGQLEAGGVGVNKSGGGTLAVNHIRSSALNVNAGTVRTIAGGGTSRVSALSVAAGAKLDLTDNKLIVAGGDAGTWDGSKYTGIAGLVDSGRGDAGNALWDGTTGITTTDARALNTGNLCGLGVATAGQLGRTTFGGLSVDPDDVLAMFTYGGDANLDGKINIDDYGRIDGNVSQSGTVFGWFSGDFNYDGKINIDDYGIIDGNINQQGEPFMTVLAAEGMAAVPEPLSISLLSVIPLLCRRWRA